MRIKYLLLLALLAAGNASAQEMTALSCNDFRPTDEAIERFPNLVGACEGIVERDGELYGLVRAVVRRVWGNNVTLHLPATGKTFTARPDSSMRVLVDGNKMRPRDLTRGQEIRIYLAVNAFSTPDIEEVAFITEQDVVVNVTVEEVEALPTTASPWPAIGVAGLLLLGTGYLLRRRRLTRATPLLLLLGAGMIGTAPDAVAETKEVQIPGLFVNGLDDRHAANRARDDATRDLDLLGLSHRIGSSANHSRPQQQ